MYETRKLRKGKFCEDFLKIFICQVNYLDIRILLSYNKPIKIGGALMDKRLRELEEEQRRLMEQMEKNESKNKYKYKSAEKHESNILLQFVIGLLLLGVGLFWIFQSVKVTSGFSSFYSIGGWSAPNGTVIIPLLIGIVMLFVMEKKIFGWIVTGIGTAIILIAVITSVRLHFSGGNLFNYVLMFGFTAVGGGLVLKSLLKK